MLITGSNAKGTQMAIDKDLRLNDLISWVSQYTSIDHVDLIPGDASFRRYVRVQTTSTTYIAVDAPPAKENSEAYVHIAAAFAKNSLKVPQVLQVDYRLGFLLLSDLGDIQLLNILSDQNVDNYYPLAIDNIIKIQRCHLFGNWKLPIFDKAMLKEELSRFDEWYVAKHLGITLSPSEVSGLHHIYELLVDSASNQPYVCVHRDYHSRNIMLLSSDNLGILDFQDAVLGPITYDLVSLLRDCYISWPAAKVYEWAGLFYTLLIEEKKISVSLLEFLRWFDLMGLQRHLKVLGIFARLCYRDAKPKYLQDVPRILEYIIFICTKYPELAFLTELINTRVLLHESNDSSSRTRQANEAAH